MGPYPQDVACHAVKRKWASAGHTCDDNSKQKGGYNEIEILR